MQTDPKVWREWRQLSGAAPYTISVMNGASQPLFGAAGGEESQAPETPVAAGGAKTQTPRLAMLLPCSRPRKPYPGSEDVQPTHADASSSGANDSLNSPFHSPAEIRGVGTESSVRMQVQTALDQVQTAVVAFLSPRGSEASPAQCLSPRSTL